MKLLMKANNLWGKVNNKVKELQNKEFSIKSYKVEYDFTKMIDLYTTDYFYEKVFDVNRIMRHHF